jgi:hypothetical protein
MPIEDIERLGVSLEQPSSVPTARIKHAAHHSNFAELEGEQKLWRWVLIALLAASLIETWLAGWMTRSSAAAGREQR